MFFSSSSSLKQPSPPPPPPMAFSFITDSSANFAVAVTLLCTGVLYICFWSPFVSDPLFSFHLNVTSPELRRISLPVDELEVALERAAAATTTGNRTVIITVVNRAYLEQSVEAETTMFDLFLESFWLGVGTRPLLDHLMVVAMDQTAYDRCLFKRLHCYRLETDGVDFGGEKVYMSDDFIRMMWRRTLFLLEVLNHGYSFIFTDTDVMWLRNPFTRLNKNESFDLQISMDKRRSHLINTGFYYARSNNKTISLFQKWYNMRHNSTKMKEQDVLISLLRSRFFDQLNLNVNFLDTSLFSGFCQDSPDFRAVTTVHANCCRHISAKVHDLTAVLRDWKRYKAAAASGHAKGTRFRWSPHVKCWDSWNDTRYNPLA